MPTPTLGIVNAKTLSQSQCGDMGLPTPVESGSLSLYTFSWLTVPSIAVVSRTETVIALKSTLLLHFLLLCLPSFFG